MSLLGSPGWANPNNRYLAQRKAHFEAVISLLYFQSHLSNPQRLRNVISEPRISRVCTLRGRDLLLKATLQAPKWRASRGSTPAASSVPFIGDASIAGVQKNPGGDSMRRLFEASSASGECSLRLKGRRKRLVALFLWQ